MTQLLRLALLLIQQITRFAQICLYEFKYVCHHYVCAECGGMLPREVCVHAYCDCT